MCSNVEKLHIEYIVIISVYAEQLSNGWRLFFFSFPFFFSFSSSLSVWGLSEMTGVYCGCSFFSCLC